MVCTYPAILTFNYDFEIERYFQDGGFRILGSTNHNVSSAQTDSRSEVRVDPIGGQMFDRTFKRSEAANLVGFVTGADGADAAVYHMHGRATIDDGIIATERDYMDLYLKDDEDRAGVEEALSLVYSANPILFVGNSMSEADVLRPLRQFISNSDRQAGYNAMVLLPGEKDHSARMQIATALFVRYGVHTIFYGGGEVAIGNSEHGSKVAVDWLYRILWLKDGVKEIIEDRSKGSKKFLDPSMRWNHLIDKVGTLGPDLAEGGNRCRCRCRCRCSGDRYSLRATRVADMANDH